MELLYCLIFIQTWYILYILFSMPHIDQLFNYLEILNEIFVVVILYCLVGFTATSVLGSHAQWMVGYIAIGLIMIIFVLNMSMLVYTVASKVILHWKKWKAKQD